MAASPTTTETRRAVVIPAAKPLPGELVFRGDTARGLVLVVGHGNALAASALTQWVAAELRARAEVATLSFDLLNENESGRDGDTSVLRNHLPLLAQRLASATDFAVTYEATRYLPLGYYAGGMATPAALLTASSRTDVRAVVSRSGRTDLAGPALDALRAPTLLVVGEADALVLALNRSARGRLRATNELAIVPSGGEAFDDPAARADLAQRASAWFVRHLR